MKPYYEHAGITIFHGDCRDIIPSLDYEVIVCDPPFGRNVSLSRRGSLTIIGDQDAGIRDWIASLEGPKILFGSPMVPRPPAVLITLIWDKSELTGMGDLSLPWKLTHEEIYVMGEGFVSTRRQGSVLRYPLRPAWTNHPDSVSGLHPNEKPLSLMVDILGCCTWDVVLDPTCGSGATLRAAKKCGKVGIGIEIEEKYCEIAAKSLSQEVFSF